MNDSAQHLHLEGTRYFQLCLQANALQSTQIATYKLVFSADGYFTLSVE